MNATLVRAHGIGMALIVDNVIATQVKFIELFSIEFVKFFFKNTMMLL
jgi:hypothetical protein